MSEEFELGNLLTFDDKIITAFISEICNEISLMRGGRQILGSLDIDDLCHASKLPESDSVLTRAASKDGELVGIVWSQITANILHEKVCQIKVLAVSKNCRGAGVGEALYLDCEKWAKLHGAIGIEVVVLPGDRHTKNFCERNGLVARSLTMFRQLL